MWRLGILLLVGCAAKPLPPPLRPTLAPARCFTFRAKSCQNQCEPIEPEIKRCLHNAQHEHFHPSGKITVHFSASASGEIENLRYELQGGDLEPVADCIQAVYRHFSPCVPLLAGQELAVPYVFAKGD